MGRRGTMMSLAALAIGATAFGLIRRRNYRKHVSTTCTAHYKQNSKVRVSKNSHALILHGYFISFM